MKTKFIFLFSLYFLPAVFAAPAFAQEGVSPVLEQKLEEMQKVMLSMQSTIMDLKNTVTEQNQMIGEQAKKIYSLEMGRPAPISIPQAPKVVGLSGLNQGFNPDIGVVGIIQAKSTENTEDGEGNDTLALKELELNIGQYVDPYSRLDAVITFNDEIEDQNVEIEEAYYTHWGLPLGFIGRIGKFRGKVGQQSRVHLDQLETVDYPLVIQDLFGEEGFAASGVRLENHIPNPWDIPLTLTGEVFRGNNGAVFSGISRRPVFNTHLSSFFNLSDDVNLELGSTFMFGDENINSLDKGDDRYGVHVFGGDATMVWNLTEGRHLKWQNEVFYVDRTHIVSPNHDPWGFYSLVDYKMSPKWSTGVRFDYLEPSAITDGHGRTTAVSPYLTFWQSEFAQFTLQYQHLDPADPDAKSDDMLIFQANVAIGNHTHPVG